ncbi:class I SAM-dependent methyltransferase [Ovoidimarina sediminis]|uniref:class I SAM-dependent methyltransferase n=1 Tax=Ovoidimarina sediminis TaxID=3079856 RepID=UPI0029110A39|nr:SAM-dependent methyltransferase [Rhodophyticola sp. MJ-SS7]MDU8942994.1 SAM-dependent methyltransferase [Rhodophyticola sp. MJ-SS7]
MDALKGQLVRRIRSIGPMPLSEYMAACLTHPEHGYYTGRDPLGARGDFTTAPEISQMFGELLGLSLAQAWIEAGAPAAVTLAEAGPGRGTLMADILRATRGVPGFHAAVTILLIEVSPTLRAVQAKALSDYDVTCAEGIEALPERPLYLVANEYFDALPIRQFRREKTGWSERMVGLGPQGELAFGWSPAAPVGLLVPREADTEQGDIVEVNLQGEADAERIGRHIAAHGGAALIVDYGDDRSLGDTFQAVRAHGFADPLDAPGAADLTAHVDFGALARAAMSAGAAVSAITPQGVFLERLGITERARAIARGLGGPALDAHIAAHRRLTHPQEMGHLFKAMSIHSTTGAPPPGLET